MTQPQPLAFALLALLMAPASALAADEEIIRAGRGGGDAPIAEPGSVLDQYRRLPDALDAREVSVRRSYCAGADDGKPHGEVHAGVGTGGWRNAGATVCQKIGDDGEVQISIDRTEGGARAAPRRRHFAETAQAKPRPR